MNHKYSEDRHYSSLAADGSDARRLVDLLAVERNIKMYRQHMESLGSLLAEKIVEVLSVSRKRLRDICVVCTVEDADFLARGVIKSLERHQLGDRVHLLCLWNSRVRDHNISISPVVRQYKEDFDTQDTTFIVLKSIISGACVVKTNLARAFSIAKPSQVFVAAPVLLEGAEERLEKEFPSHISELFQFIWFATDRIKEGEIVRPGIGGSVYERLGFENEKAKNWYIPKLVKERMTLDAGHPMEA